MTNIIDVSTEAELDAAIAEANAGASGSSFEIVLQADITENYVLVNAVDLPTSVTLSISDGAFTLAGPYALAPAITIASGDTLAALAGIPSGEMITFGGIGSPSTVLAIAAPSLFAGTIEGFASGDVLAISSTITAAAPGTYNSANNTTSLVLKDGTETVATLSLEGDYSAASFNVSADDVTVALPSAATTLSTGAVVSGTREVAAGATTTQTGQITFGSGSDPATVINQGTYAITGAWGISAGDATSLLINGGTLERAANGVNEISYIDVNVIDTGTIIVPDNNPNGDNTNLRFDGANNSFSGGYIGGGMIDYGNPDDVGSGIDYLDDINMEEGACTTSWATVNQSGEITLSDGSTIANYGTWNFTSENGITLATPTQNQDSYAEFTNYGMLATTGNTGTTVVELAYWNPYYDPANHNLGGTGLVNVAAGTTLAIDATGNGDIAAYFDNPFSGAGTLSIGGGGDNQIESGTTIATGGWVISSPGTEVTLNEALSYSGTFLAQSGTTLTLADALTLTGLATFANATVKGSGTLATNGPTSVTGAVTFANGVTLTGTGLVSIASSSTLNALGTVDSGTTIEFAGTDGLLDIGTASGFSGTIKDFASGDSLGVSTTITTATPGNFSSGITPLILKDGGMTVATLNLGGNYQGDTFTVTNPSAETYDIKMPCYCRGTLIRSRCGEVPVEALTIGDKVLTKSGEERPIRWIGRRSYGGRFTIGRKDVLPICIKANALDNRVPERDLWLSPHHALYLDGMLIEAKDLVNGVSIVQADRVEKVEYFHIELETHDVIIAEGALAESFIDDDCRGMFSNAHECRQLYGDVARGLVQYCAPRCDEGYRVEAERRRIALRAGVSAEDGPRIGKLRGFVDRVSANSVEGWAQNVEHPEAPVCLDIYASDRFIGQVLANRYREDLARAQLGSGRHAFVYKPQRGSIISFDEVQVRRSLDATALPGTRFPRTVAA